MKAEPTGPIYQCAVFYINLVDIRVLYPGNICDISLKHILTYRYESPKLLSCQDKKGCTARVKQYLFASETKLS